jgi:hypothetical protein
MMTALTWPDAFRTKGLAGAKIYFEFNGIALLRPEDKARVFTTSMFLRTGDAR